jgi:hypothetical protein
MGYGDEIIASGLARGARARGKRIAFGDGSRIFWSRQSHEIFRNNPNVAPPGDERASDLEWVRHFKGDRLYGDVRDGRWRFRPFVCPPGELFFDPLEGRRAAALWPNFDPAPIIIEPTVKPMGACDGQNKQWPMDRYLAVAKALSRMGERPMSLGADGIISYPELPRLVTPTFREALLVLASAKLYIGPEGGLHHAAAALGIPAVVIFGGFNSPASTGYPWHANLTAGGEPCGTIAACPHCAEAMRSISVDRVLLAALQMRGRHAGIQGSMVSRR